MSPGAASAVGGNGCSGRHGRAEWPSSSSTSSSAPGIPEGKRLTPDTGSDGESDEMDGHGDGDGNEKDGSEEYELREGVKLKHEEDVGAGAGAGASGGRWRRRRKRHLYTAEEEQSVVRKFDKKLVVFLAVLYMLSFLDRSSPFPPPSLAPGARPC